MQGLVSWLAPRWPVLAFLVSGALLAGAHAFQRFADLYPCVMCLRQREAHWLILGLSAALFVGLRFIKMPAAPRIAAALLGAAFLWSFYQGGHHVAVEQHWVTATCEVDSSTLGEIGGPIDFDAPVVAPKCDEIAWSLFGISLAGFNAIISALMALMSFAIALTARRKLDA